MPIRNVLMVAAAFIVVMAMVLIFYGDDSPHGMSVSHADEQSESIDDARKAYWEQDLLKAERLYRIITKADDASVDAWGELGNIYYLQARWKEAANAYAEVTLRLIDQKEMQQAAFFHRLVHQMDPEQSARINKRLSDLNANSEQNS